MTQLVDNLSWLTERLQRMIHFWLGHCHQQFSATECVCLKETCYDPLLKCNFYLKGQNTST